MTVICMTAAQAEQVKGLSTPGAELEPVSRADGKFIVGIEVLSDHAHEAKWPLLSTFPQEEYQPIGGDV